MNKEYKIAYHCLILRYVHDITTQEFVNVGALLCTRNLTYKKFKYITNLDRLLTFWYHSLDNAESEWRRQIILGNLKHFETRCSDISITPDIEDFIKIVGNIMLPEYTMDTYYWSPNMISGISNDVEKTHNTILERYCKEE